MKRMAVFLFLLIVAGCHVGAQQPPLPPVYQCPTTTGTNYTPLNPTTSTTNPPVAGTSYTDSAVGVGHWCYIAQTYDGQQLSLASNSDLVTVAASQTVNLTWTPPSGTGLTFVLSRAAAILQPIPTAPALNPNPKVARLELNAEVLTIAGR
jgi:hypothetical protein